MVLIEWSKDLELGIPEIDRQHRKLVEMLNEFYTELEKGEKAEAVKHFLENLEEYLKYHLDYEERFMEEIGFPETESHKKVHQMFKKLYTEEKERFLKGDVKALRELVAFTFSWLFSHIMKTDRKYADYINNTKS
ncbi:hemerythrin family protein [Persephonella atlantica]|uniref:Hemerythrin family protein n=1 Tax=Persephonella atlantica TaxID=2699429 RepID=A0ABS1GJ09_9AQUI|nr:bacteriohemerythrin [Persephonella atlantica]MBK3332908.1 hemerythrin family protein [Persephonella atlantica]